MFVCLYPGDAIKIDGFDGWYTVLANPTPLAGFEYSAGYSPWDDTVMVDTHSSDERSGPWATLMRAHSPIGVDRAFITGVI